MNIKTAFILPMVISLSTISASAMSLKAVAFSAEEIVTLLKQGKASASKLVDMEFYRSAVSKHALLGTFKRAGKSDVHVLVSRTKGEGMDVLNVHLVTPLDASVKEAIDNLPMTYIMHGSIGDAGEEALKASGLVEEGLRLMGDLVQSRAVTITETPIYDLMAKIKAVRASGMDIQSPRGNILLDQNFVRNNWNGVAENLDLRYIKSLEGGGPAASFEMRMAISENTTSEQLRRVMDVLSQGLN